MKDESTPTADAPSEAGAVESESLPDGVELWQKKPVVIQAMKLANRNTPEAVAEWCGGRINKLPYTGGGPVCTIVIPTLEGEMEANRGDWIVKGVKGEFYPVKPDIFSETYEEPSPVPSPSELCVNGAGGNRTPGPREDEIAELRARVEALENQLRQ